MSIGQDQTRGLGQYDPSRAYVPPPVPVNPTLKYGQGQPDYPRPPEETISKGDGFCRGLYGVSSFSIKLWAQPAHTHTYIYSKDLTSSVLYMCSCAGLCCYCCLDMCFWWVGFSFPVRCFLLFLGSVSICLRSLLVWSCWSDGTCSVQWIGSSSVVSSILGFILVRFLLVWSCWCVYSNMNQSRYFQNGRPFRWMQELENDQSIVSKIE